MEWLVAYILVCWNINVWRTILIAQNHRHCCCRHPTTKTFCLSLLTCYFNLIVTGKLGKPEPKARVSYCHSAPSVVHPSVVRKLFTFSTSPEPLDGFWWNLVGMKYSWSLTSVVVFQPDQPRGGYRAGQNRSRGGRGPLLQRTSSDWKATATNRMHSSDLEACGKKCCYFWFHSKVKF